MKMIRNSILFILFFSAVNYAMSDETSVLQDAHEATWKAINAKDAMKGSDVHDKALSIKDRIKLLIDSGHLQSTKAFAKNLASSAKSATKRSMNLPPDVDSMTAVDRHLQSGKVLVFISNSMPRGQVRSLLESLKSTNHNVEVAYRGLFKGNRNITQFTKQLSYQLNDMGIESSNASIGLNPTIFREVGVSVVPTLAYIHSDKSISRLTGVVNIDRFVEDLSDTGVDLGNDGATYDIEEKDFFVELQERMAMVDWKKKVQSAKDNYWKKQSPYDLSISMNDESYDVDMTVEVNENIYAEYNGERHVIATKGQRFNPLYQPSMAGFNRRMLIFNPNDSRQIKWAIDQVNEALLNNERPMVMLTSLLEGNRSETFSDLEGRLNVKIYLVQDVIIQRFNVQKIPTIIRRKNADSGLMSVTNFSCRGVDTCEM
jgi:hypothetical protein